MLIRRAITRKASVHALSIALMITLAGLLSALGTRPCAALDIPPFSLYQAGMPPPPKDGLTAIATLDQRREVVTRWNACGLEPYFLDMVMDLQSGTSASKEDLLVYVIAKEIWLLSHEESVCTQYLSVPNGWQLRAGWYADAQRGLATQINQDFFTAFKDPALPDAAQACQSLVREPVPTGPSGAPDQFVYLTFTLSRACLKRQANVAIMALHADSQPGTNGSVCYVFGKSSGDYDVATRDLLRVYYLDARGRAGPTILDEATRTHLFDDLLTIDGPPIEDSYSLFQCGDQEHDSGSPQDRADDQNWTDNSLFRDLGDILDWLLRRLIVFTILGAAVGVALAIFGPAVAALLAAAGGIAVTALTVARIPESENHVLMINASRYLTNQIIISSLQSPDDQGVYQSYNAATKAWLLARLHRIASEDFIEYNAKPYQRYSLTALLDLRDFSSDVDIKTAADLVLQAAFAKAALGSAQSRRSVPFRRLMDVVAQEERGPGTEGDSRPRRLLDMNMGSDHQSAYLLYYAGQTAALPSYSPGIGNASLGAIGEMVYVASSGFLPDSSIIDLAINKGSGIEQRFHHGGWEAYSNGAGFVLSAGGVESDFAYPILLTAIDLSPEIVSALHTKVNGDRGTALPTVLIPNGAGSGEARGDFLRIEGPKKAYAVDNGDTSWTYDHNLCMAKGFACGTGIRIPGSLQAFGCLSPAAGNFQFLDSTQCDATKAAAPFFVALYLQNCTAGQADCVDNFGFLETVDAGGDTLSSFKTRVLTANPAPITDAANMLGTYVSSKNTTIVFNARGHQADDNNSGIVSINGAAPSALSNWPLADGDTMTNKGDGSYVIHNKHTQVTITLDFSDAAHPKPLIAKHD